MIDMNYDERVARLRADLEAMRRDAVQRAETIERMRREIEELLAKIDAAVKRLGGTDSP